MASCEAIKQISIFNNVCVNELTAYYLPMLLLAFCHSLLYSLPPTISLFPPSSSDTSSFFCWLQMINKISCSAGWPSQLSFESTEMSANLPSPTPQKALNNHHQQQQSASTDQGVQLGHPSVSASRGHIPNWRVSQLSPIYPEAQITKNMITSMWVQLHAALTTTFLCCNLLSLLWTIEIKSTPIIAAILNLFW